ncbi:prephenate dehydrogenase [Acetobacterium tundrae]|uniref:Prephenate dehydrogenase/arogenate dehydrogenase family protein n=1 Tax=Acetobacterium tundrae TaxID=132932 RepID=A0ABR6WJF4_9FIRM|nr:prephenate dehydrogenase [Acetobacterium tundrae]MBC3796272.1 prephenate dehydrogenase/arogenate dehydrogenase family protein [Acetobacterium tundrae]
MKKREDSIVGFIGLGLMGGALAMGLRKQGPRKIWGYDIDPTVIKMAIDRKVIDEGAFDSEGLKKMLPQCDLLFICLSPKDALVFLTTYMEHFKTGAVITDITGVKEVIVKKLGNRLRNDIDYIPGHPMAGSEKEGFGNADDSIFKNRNYILTPLPTNQPENIELIKEIVTDLGFNHITETTCEIHDEKIAFTSQLCHIIAAALVDCEDDLSITDFEGGSFGDLTRIAMINAAMWTELFMCNRKNLLNNIEKFESSLEEMKRMIEAEESAELIQRLTSVREKRIIMGEIREAKNLKKR